MGPFTGASNVTLDPFVKNFSSKTLPLPSHDVNIMNKEMDDGAIPTGNQWPLQLNFADDGTVDVSLEQQYAIYVMFSSYHADLGNEAIGRGRALVLHALLDEG